jgi:SMC interacting uncharacterized protein involved in chromosome segregation
MDDVNWGLLNSAMEAMAAKMERQAAEIKKLKAEIAEKDFRLKKMWGERSTETVVELNRQGLTSER